MNFQGALAVDRRSVCRLARFVLTTVGIPEGELGVALVDDAEMQRLHRQYRREEGMTDVLAFDPGDAPRAAGAPEVIGDVVVNAERAKARAKGGERVARELSLYVVHGILHLLGERDGTEAERRRMWSRQRAVLAAAASAEALIRVGAPRVAR